MDGGRITRSVETEFQDFTYRVSHDLGAPVRAMVEFSKLIANEYADGLSQEAKEYFSIIVSSGQQMQAMMDGLLEYSRITTRASAFMDTDLKEIIEECRILLESKITASGAVIEVGELPMVSCDRAQISRVIHILLDNALSYQPVGQAPKISFSVKPAAQDGAGGWRISIADNGIGIDPHFFDKIYQMFQRLHTNEMYPGNGIGLTLARKIVHRHGGDIWCESMPGKGSTFHFTLNPEKAVHSAGDGGVQNASGVGLP